jgi:hypothetical protein
MLESEKFMMRCIELIQNTKDLSEEVLMIMFMQYKRLIEEEQKLKK